ncbi:hypothetical protein diail_2594, partial [Diaporthe ilicicola]
SHQKEDKDERWNSNSDGDQSPGEIWPFDPDPRLKQKRRMAIPPTSHNTSSGPFSTLAVLTDLLDLTRNDDENLYSAYR